jgi:hypothetical protein
MVLSTTW